jgi:AcrR family transcriptional regulator
LARHARGVAAFGEVRGPVSSFRDDDSGSARHLDGRRVRNPEQTLQRLIAAARTVFSARGYAAATVDEIVAAAGVSKGAFYNHFNAKEEIFLVLLEGRGDSNRARFLETCRACPDLVRRVLCIVETIVGYANEDPAWSALSVEFMAHAMRNSTVGNRVARLHVEWRALIADLLRDAFPPGASSVIDVESLAICLVALLDGLIMHARMEPALLDAGSLSARVEPLVRLWIDGLAVAT